MERYADTDVAVRAYKKLKAELGRVPSSREFYKVYSKGELSLLFEGGRVFSQLQQLCGDSPNRFSSAKSSRHKILRQWGELARETLHAREQLPIQDDWRRAGIRPTVSGIQKSHGLKWSDVPHRFVEEFSGEAQWSDVVAAISPAGRNVAPKETPTAEECYVYLILDSRNRSHKIGMSRDPWKRERTLQSEEPKLTLVAAKKYVNRKIALAIEKALHNVYDHKKKRGEYFELDDEDLYELRRTLDDPVG
ncbi:MAG: GIY-YIG nuclease family protein [Armatimonadetes bacterium]|nr:MAG: GIY-YIG nuclease family protein [Armatimonadota bacterium]